MVPGIAKLEIKCTRHDIYGHLLCGGFQILMSFLIHSRLEWISNILVVVSAGLFVAFGAGVRSDSGRSAAAVGIVFVVVLEVGHR